MKLINTCQINILIILILFSSFASLSAESKNKAALDEISKQLRCMTCQNQTVYESDTNFSKQMKKEILEQLMKKKSKTEIIDFMIERYGEYILLKPKFSTKNLFLWIAPFVLFSLSLLIIFLKLRKH